MVFILMGVSGSGKTTIGQMLAGKLGLPFYDADEFHPSANVEKMEAGIPLNDADRAPWLKSLSQEIQKWNKAGGAVLACSALKESYRKILESGNSGEVRFIYLKGDRDLIMNRMMKRKGHYMPPSLLKSQFDTLEEPENAIEISVSMKPESMVAEILKKIEST